MAGERLLPNEEVLVSTEERAAKFDEMANQIYEDYRKEGVTEIKLISVLNGGIVTTVHLGERLESLGMSVRLKCMQVSRYGGKNESTKEPTIYLSVNPEDVQSQHLLVTEDVRDDGITLVRIRRLLGTMSPASLKVAVLTDKINKEELEKLGEDARAEYVGFETPKTKWLFGSGMDKDGQTRRFANFIGAVKPNGQSS